MANNNNNFVDILVDAQKQAVDSVLENTKKFANGNTIVNETAQKGSDFYKNWLDGQKKFMNQATEKAGNMQQQFGQSNEFFQNWYNTQNNWTKQIWDMNNNLFQSTTNNAQNAANMNPMNQWQNMMNNWNTWTSSMNNTNQWMNMMQQWNTLFNTDTYSTVVENWKGAFAQSQEMMNGSWAKMQENMKNGTAQDAYKNMMNATESFTKFYELWSPMWKNIQDKNFNMDTYKQFMNPAGYKDLMDKMLGFMPESSRGYLQQMTAFMQDSMKQMNGNGMQNFQQMRNMFGQAMPNNTNGFADLMNGYNYFQNMMTEAAAPFNKMFAQNQSTKNMMEWQDIANRAAIYNIKNAELQYMVYNQGTKSMDVLAENIMAKIQSGEEINSIMALFQEWMNLSDKTFVSLFESDDYSKLMAEVSAMQLKLKKDVENQMEHVMVGIPVATRSEMDELYKTIYDLKKQMRQMEKMMDLGNEETVEEPKTTTRKTAKK